MSPMTNKNKYKNNNLKKNFKNNKKYHDKTPKKYREPNKFEGPDKLITNSYNLRLIMLPKEFVIDDIKADFKEKGPFTDVPFYIINRMRGKTFFSIITTSIEFERYTHMDYTTSMNEAIKNFFGSDKFAYKAYQVLDGCVNWKDLSGTDIKFDGTSYAYFTFDENGNHYTWMREYTYHKNQPKIPAINDMAVIEKRYLDRLNEFMKDFFNTAAGAEIAEAMSFRDELALRYVDWICNDCKRSK